MPTLRTTRHQFRWELPYRYDEAESPVVVSYSYYHGKKRKRPWPSRDPADDDPDLVEDIEIRYADGPYKGQDIAGTCPNWLYDLAETACWNDASKREPQENDR